MLLFSGSGRVGYGLSPRRDCGPMAAVVSGTEFLRRGESKPQSGNVTAAGLSAGDGGFGAG